MGRRRPAAYSLCGGMVVKLVIRNVEPKLYTRLKLRAAARGHSMEEEARQLLREGLAAKPAFHDQRLGDAIRAIIEPLGGVELPTDLRPRSSRPPPDFSEPEAPGEEAE